ncbi:ADP-ribose pyrophosphatase [Candidatus Campbellbacteria bacterium CG22_combo_CG10-13_8_21_14_all_36_13]|uniref:ADP-ribose pyrophosphatase n=1 Tax=Candidatus Campbellbacteria bacterium CG22_combo_CG10-13_8_21_14_all_36_13 TaxID=1974529 RepID=A0A2H0DYS5_9BACT|nr:MAG: ADP-ribose pyrophosphatase [Candidatus Campbellbacteria bacterium CG22_combo_CG10-13_8_21_14_all_36_13]
MKELTLLNPENVSEEEIKTYGTREAARAVVLDKENNIALLHATKTDYYKLPGGGLDDDTDKVVALKRECREEIGCDVEVVGEIGLMNEWRRFFNLHQISYCYFAKVVGEKGIPDFTESEVAEGFEVVWLPYNEALDILKRSKAEQIAAKEYMVPRDIAILEAARDALF